MTALIVSQLFAFLLLAVLALLPHRETGRSALYVLAAGTCRLICKLAALLPALATVIEELPRRIADEWRVERARDSFERSEMRAMESIPFTFDEGKKRGR